MTESWLVPNMAFAELASDDRIKKDIHFRIHLTICWININACHQHLI